MKHTSQQPPNRTPPNHLPLLDSQETSFPQHHRQLLNILRFPRSHRRRKQPRIKLGLLTTKKRERVRKAEEKREAVEQKALVAEQKRAANMAQKIKPIIKGYLTTADRTTTWIFWSRFTERQAVVEMN